MRAVSQLSIAVASLAAFLALPVEAIAQEQAQGHPQAHKHYTLVDIGTLGGPSSGFEGGAVALNNRGIGTGVADTPLFDPVLGIPVFHAFRWQGGVLSDLGTLPDGEFSIGQAINERGAVAGFSTNGLIDPVFGPAFVATTWKPDGQIANLGTLGGEFSIPNAINDRGDVAGGATNTIPDPNGFGAAVIDIPAPTEWHAALWRNGTIRDLGTLGEGTVSFAFLLNGQGQVAGNSTTDSIPTIFGIPTLHPFLWDPQRGLIDVGTLGGVFSVASALNDRGQVVGRSTLTGDETNHAFLWERGQIRDLGTLGGTQSAANAINNAGEIVGETFPVAGNIHAFFWKRGVMSDIGTVSGCLDSNATSINSSGQVVGEAFTCENSSHAFLSENGGPAIDLNDLVPPGSELFLVEAEYINDRGEIAGLGILPNGDGRGFLLIPKEHDDAADFAAEASVAQTSSTGLHARPVPEMSTAVRNLLTMRHRRLGLELPKRSN